MRKKTKNKKNLHYLKSLKYKQGEIQKKYKGYLKDAPNVYSFTKGIFY